MQVFDFIPPSNVFIETLIIGTNFINGSISEDISRLSFLKELDVSVTDVSGSIPSEIGLVTSLKNLNVGITNIEGNIPTELCNASLVELRLQGLQFERTEIPTELGLCTLLGKFSIPSSEETATHLMKRVERMLLDMSELGGTLPSELGRLTLLKSLGASQNFITGSIPVEFKNLKTLGQLNLQNNLLLEGTIPDILCNNFRDVSFAVTPRIECHCCLQIRKI
jgi:Leucine-rich repeat (LRR) protein